MSLIGKLQASIDRIHTKKEFDKREGSDEMTNDGPSILKSEHVTPLSDGTDGSSTKEIETPTLTAGKYHRCNVT
jgi:hypothetical protein